MKVVDLQAFYGRAQILFNVDFSLRKGEIVSLIGRNGVGKTTLLKAIMNIEVVKRGKIFLNGSDVTNLPTYRIAAKGIGYMPDYTGLIPGVSVIDNIRLAAGKKNVDLSQASEVYPEIKNLLNRRADSLSGGEKKIVGLLRLLFMNPSIIMVDEPTEGVSPIVAKKIYEMLTAMKKKGLTVFLVEQGTRYNLLTTLADRLLVMVGGKIVLESTSETIEKERELIKRYLAVSGET